MIQIRTSRIIMVTTVMLIGTIVWYVTLKNLYKPIRYRVPDLALESTSSHQSIQTTQVTSEKIEMTSWKTYRDELHGLEFRYPHDIDGKPVTIKPPDEFNQIIVFESERNQVRFKLYDLKDRYSIGDAHDPIIGGGYYLYDPSENTWRHYRYLPRKDNHMGDGTVAELTQVLSWAEMFEYLRTPGITDEKIKHLPIIQTESGLTGFPFYRFGYDGWSNGYRIFDPLKLINFQIEAGHDNFAPSPELEQEIKATEDFLQNVVKTVKFF